MDCCDLTPVSQAVSPPAAACAARRSGRLDAPEIWFHHRDRQASAASQAAQ
ncbi:UNVERIFIED_ORG: hypothetical protein QOE_2265 [Clostridioides difficile F501]